MEIPKNPKLWQVFTPIAIAGALLYGGVKYANSRSEAIAKPNLETKVERVVREDDIIKINDSNTLTYAVKETPEKNQDVDYKTNDFSKDSDNVLLARMLFGEARNCSKNEKIAIAYTAINRVNDGKKWNGENVKEVILKLWQYSCFNKNDVNYKKLKNPDKKVFVECLEVAEEVIEGKYKELNKGQTHYFNPKTVNPKWAAKMYRLYVGNTKHEFYREK